MFLYRNHYNDVIMSLTIFYSADYSGADQRKHQSFASLAFVLGICYRSPVNFPHKRPAVRKMFPFDCIIMRAQHCKNCFSWFCEKCMNFERIYMYISNIFHWSQWRFTIRADNGYPMKRCKPIFKSMAAYFVVYCGIFFYPPYDSACTNMVVLRLMLPLSIYVTSLALGKN